MIDREKVIRGLELCAYDPDPGQELKEIRSCPECPYYRAGCSPQLIRDALALLKEQEPRVLTLDEVLNAEDFVWAEIYTPKKWSWCVVYVKINSVVGNDEIVLIEEDCGTGWTKAKSDYGKRGFLDGGWRCWSARPSPDQMRETPWEAKEGSDAE